MIPVWLFKNLVILYYGVSLRLPSLWVIVKLVIVRTVLLRATIFCFYMYVTNITIKLLNNNYSYQIV